MKAGAEVYLHAFLTLALDGGEQSASCPACFTPRKRAPGIHWIQGWVGPIASLNKVVIWIISNYRKEFALYEMCTVRD
jgi:hypothetical protein